MPHRHLFIDDHEIDTITSMARKINQPVKHPLNPVLDCENPWEILGVQTYGTVIFDSGEGLFRMWYLTHAGPSDETVKVEGIDRPANMTLVAYAESEDGVNWVRPELRQVSFQKSRRNNLVRIGRCNVEGISVIRDQNGDDPSRRFKAFYWDHGSGELVQMDDGSVLWGEGKGDGMWVSFSPDGLEWTDYPQNPVITAGSDTGQSVVWDPARDLYVAYGRFGAGGRKVARSESEDFINWNQSKLVLEPDRIDGPDTEFYGISVTIYEGIYIGLLWVFHIQSRGSQHGGKDIGSIDIQLVSSRDGIDWRRVCDRSVFIPNGPDGAWDSKIIQAACRFIPWEDRILIFYNGSPYRHGEGRSRGNSRIGMATLRRDGFVSLDAGDEDGTMTTKPMEWTSSEMHLNVDATHGEVRAEILDIEGRSITGPSKVITGNHLDKTVSWPAYLDRATPPSKIRARLSARNAKIYSYWFA